MYIFDLWITYKVLLAFLPRNITLFQQRKKGRASVASVDASLSPALLSLLLVSVYIAEDKKLLLYRVPSAAGEY